VSDASAPTGGQVRFLALLGEMIGDDLARAEETLAAHLASDVPFIDRAGRYLSDAGGKRLRPAMLLLAARSLGLGGAEPVTYAAVVEMIHTATLVHDDVIDHAELRRGRETLHRLAGNHRTVLLGDWLYTASMRLALTHGNVEVIRRLCEATLGMTEGELLVLDRLGAVDLERDEYFQIIHRKTARLFAASCSIPSLIEGPASSEETGRALHRFGERLGLCFQLVDDLLDFTASEDQVGKPVLSDLKEGKLTLPLILALEGSGQDSRERVSRVLEDRSFERTDPEEVLELVAERGTLEETAEIARRLAVEAREALAPLPDSPARDLLELAPELLLERRS
jgi:octaprenyl-diphosphate synthase